MNGNEFEEQIARKVDQAANDGVSHHTIEDVLQAKSQRVRENRRVYQVFVYECPKPNCEETATQLVDQMELHCDICERALELTHSKLQGEVELMEFECTDHATTRVHEFSKQELTYSIHNEMMQLMRSQTTEDGLGV